jgi:hypothetical protein
VPFPPDYGGVFDLFYKITALHKAGIRIHLHCFEYGRGEQRALNLYCASVNYYQRLEGHKGFSNKIPYIVASRANKSLLDNLLQDDYPILMEGIHCTYFLQDERLQQRRCIVRLHNVEFAYYEQLAKSTRSLLKKAYYLHESKLLRRYEKAIAQNPRLQLLAVTEDDAARYRSELGAEHIDYLPVFTPFHEVKAQEGLGNYCLYHGNLSVAENEKAAIWLLENVFTELKVNFVIAGKHPSHRLERLAHRQQHTCIVADPDEQGMQDLISRAHINILPSFNNTGIKLKLLNALYNGRHCVANPATVAGTGLEPACHVGSSPEALRQIVAQLYHQPFAAEEIQLRQRLLLNRHDNGVNAQRLIRWIW